MTPVGTVLTAVTDVAFAAVGSRDEVDPVAPVLRAVQRVIGADIAGFYSHEWRGWTTPLYVTPADGRAIVPYGRTSTAFAVSAHPAIRHLVRDRPTDPFRITDLVPDRVWQASPLARMMRPDWGRNQQLHIPVAPGYLGQESQVWVLGRMHTAFGDHEREVARALAPLLTAVAQHRAVLMSGLVQAADTTLTPRELAVLTLYTRGWHAGEIAARLGMSTRTAQKHTENIHRKLGVHDRAGTITACESLGMVAPAP